MSDLSEEEAEFATAVGRKIGETIVSLFEVLATMTGVPVRDVIDEWVAGYFAERTANPDNPIRE